MRVILLNTGTELLLGDVQDAHLPFIAREILPLGLRIEERRTVPDSDAIRQTLAELFPRCEILFVTGGLGPTTDDITREMVAELLGLELRQIFGVAGFAPAKTPNARNQMDSGIARQADVPCRRTGSAQRERQRTRTLSAREHQSADSVSASFFAAWASARASANVSGICHADPALTRPGPGLDRATPLQNRRQGGVAGRGGDRRKECLPFLELSWVIVRVQAKSMCALSGKQRRSNRPTRSSHRRWDRSIFSAADETLEEVIVKLLAERNQTLAVAESCTGGLLANRITNVPGASDVFLAGYVCYANQAKIDMLDVDPQLIEKHGAVSEQVARALAEHARASARSDYALATTGVAGPGGGSPEKPVGTVYIALAASDETIAKKLFFPTDRETFKQMATQAALDLLRRKLIETSGIRRTDPKK